MAFYFSFGITGCDGAALCQRARRIQICPILHVGVYAISSSIDVRDFICLYTIVCHFCFNIIYIYYGGPYGKPIIFNFSGGGSSIISTFVVINVVLSSSHWHFFRRPLLYKKKKNTVLVMRLENRRKIHFCLFHFLV